MPGRRTGHLNLESDGLEPTRITLTYADDQVFDGGSLFAGDEEFDTSDIDEVVYHLARVARPRGVSRLVEEFVPAVFRCL